MNQKTARKSDESPKKPEMSLLMSYQTVREKLSAYMAYTLQRIPIPDFMVEGILSAMLADVRGSIISQLSGEREEFDNQTAAYYEAELESQREQLRQAVEEFENGAAEKTASVEVKEDKDG